MYRRPVKRYRIVDRAAKAAFGICGSNDFSLVHVANTRDLELPLNCVPYCTDLMAERLLFVTVDDPDAALGAPFVYRALYEGARELITVPVERAGEWAGRPKLAPLLIFSVGRCGSTLFSALLNAAQYRSISEPDFLCQFALIKRDQLAQAGLGQVETAMRAGLGWLEQRLGPAIAVKFRSQCNRGVGLYRRALPNARYVFMLRDKPSWILSVHRAFGESPQIMADRLRGGIVAYDQLLSLGCEPALIWYEDVQSQPHETVMRLVGNDLGAEVRAAIDQVMQQDSQAGTVIAQKIVQRRKSDAEVMEEFQTLWSQLAPYELIEKHGLGRLL